MKLNQQLLQINRNVLLCFIVSASLSAVVAQLLSDYENYLNTTFTIIFGYIVYFGIFSCLFYWDNKKTLQDYEIKFDQKRVVSFDFIVWSRRDNLSWSKMANIVLFSRDWNRTILGIINFRNYFNCILYGNSYSVSKKDKDVLVIL